MIPAFGTEPARTIPDTPIARAVLMQATDTPIKKQEKIATILRKKTKANDARVDRSGSQILERNSVYFVWCIFRAKRLREKLTAPAKADYIKGGRGGGIIGKHPQRGGGLCTGYPQGGGMSGGRGGGDGGRRGGIGRRGMRSGRRGWRSPGRDCRARPGSARQQPRAGYQVKAHSPHQQGRAGSVGRSRGWRSPGRHFPGVHPAVFPVLSRCFSVLGFPVNVIWGFHYFPFPQYPGIVSGILWRCFPVRSSSVNVI